MTDYELTYITQPLSEDLEDELLDAFDCITGVDHDGQSYVTITASGTTAVQAMKDMHLQLMSHGVVIEQLQFDLVNRSELARRTGLTPQAIGNYIRGDRRKGDRFPVMFSDVAGGVWLWGDVVRWLRGRGLEDPAPGMDFPTRGEIVEADACIARAYAQPLMELQSKDHWSFSLNVDHVAEATITAGVILLPHVDHGGANYLWSIGHQDQDPQVKPAKRGRVVRRG